MDLQKKTRHSVGMMEFLSRDAFVGKKLRA
jgi:hypothetical protein